MNNGPDKWLHAVLDGDIDTREGTSGEVARVAQYRDVLGRLEKQRVSAPAGLSGAIMAALPDIDKNALRITLQRHTASTKYLKAVSAGGARFGLNGVAQGDVTPEQQQLATQDLRERFRKKANQHRDALKAQEHQARLHQLVDKFKPR